MSFIYLLRLTLFISIATIAASLAGWAQSPRAILIEEFTNASCSPCAEQNPAFERYLERHHDEELVIPVIYHANLPGRDTMNAENPAMHDGRTAHYGISAVPTTRVNGTIPKSSGSAYAGAPGDTLAISRAVAGYDGTTSPITILIWSERIGSRLLSSIEVVGAEPIAGARLFIVVVERHHYYGNAGTNGERDFHYIARRMWPDNGGIELRQKAGEVRELSFDTPVAPEWNPSELFVVAFIQNDETREIVQARSSRGLLRVEEQARTMQVQQEDAPVDWRVMLRSSVMREYDVTIEEMLPSGWKSDVVIDHRRVSGSARLTLPGEPVPMDLSIIPSRTAPGKGSVIVTFKGINGTYLRQRFTAYSSGLTALVIVKDEGNPTIASYYDQGMARTGIPYAVVERGDEDLFDLTRHVIVYEVGRWAIEHADLARLKDLFDRGGRILLAGTEIAFALSDPRNTDPRAARDPEFLTSRLHATYIDDGSYDTSAVRGFAGDPVGDGLSFSIANGVQNQYTPDRIAPRDGARPVFCYGGDPDRIAGIRYADTKNRLIYLGFGLEGIGSTTKRGEVLDRSIDWLLGGETTSGAEMTPVIATTPLGAPFPNPASGAFEVPLRLDRSSHVAITLHDLLGARVAVVADRPFEQGEHVIRFDPSGMPGGIYTLVARIGKRELVRQVRIIR